MGKDTFVATATLRPRSRLFLILPLAMAVAAIAGFWPRYYGRLATGVPLDPWFAHPLVHIHAALFLGWLAIVAAQSALAIGGRVDLHRRFGNYLFAYGACSIVFMMWAVMVLASRPLQPASSSSSSSPARSRA